MSLDLNDAANWELAHESFHTAVPAPGGGFTPIPPVEINTTFTTPIIAVGAESQQARSWWRKGGDLYQVIDVPGSDFVTIDGSKIFVPINNARVFRFDLECTYRLRFEPAWWHPEISLSVYRYIGQIPVINVLTL